jgi:hypothetical protein
VCLFLPITDRLLSVDAAGRHSMTFVSISPFSLAVTDFFQLIFLIKNLKKKQNRERNEKKGV